MTCDNITMTSYTLNFVGTVANITGIIAWCGSKVLCATHIF